jgi:hypothetical protein
MGISPFEVFKKTPDRFAARREDGQADHEEKNSLKDGEKKAKDSKPDEGPPDDQESNLLEFVHGGVRVDNILRRWRNQAKPFAPVIPHQSGDGRVGKGDEYLSFLLV